MTFACCCMLIELGTMLCITWLYSVVSTLLMDCYVLSGSIFICFSHWRCFLGNLAYNSLSSSLTSLVSSPTSSVGSACLYPQCIQCESTGHLFFSLYLLNTTTTNVCWALSCSLLHTLFLLSLSTIWSVVSLLQVWYATFQKGNLLGGVFFFSFTQTAGCKYHVTVLLLFCNHIVFSCFIFKWLLSDTLWFAANSVLNLLSNWQWLSLLVNWLFPLY